MLSQHPQEADARSRCADRAAVRTGTALLLALLLTLGTACGGGESQRVPEPGTLSVVNNSDQGMAPVTVTSFFFVPAAGGTSPTDLLEAPINPGGVVIVGQFQEGLYNGVAVLDVGGQVPFNDVEMKPGEPTTLVIP